MATKLGSLLIELGMDSAKFRSDLKRSQREMTGFQRGVGSAANFVKGAISGMLGAFTVDVIVDAVRAGLDHAAALGEQAQQLGVTTKALQEYRYAATQVGLSQEEMDKSLSELNKRLGQAAAGASGPTKALERLGISVRDANGNVRDAGETIPLIAEALKAIPTPAERAAVLVELFGRAGQKLAPLLADGAAGVNNLRDAAQRLGVVLSDEQIAKADETADKLDAVKTVLQARLAGAVADNADSIIRLADALGNLADKAFRAVDAIKRFADSDVGRAISNINRAASFLNPVGAAAGLLTSAPTAPARQPVSRVNPNRPLNAAPSYLTPGPARPAYNRNAGPVRFFNDNEGDQVFATVNSVRRAMADVVAIAPSFRAELTRASDETKALLEQLFPVEGGKADLEDNIKLLDAALAAGTITVARHTAAVAALNREYGTLGEGLPEWRQMLGDLPEVQIDVPSDPGGDLVEAWDATRARLEDVNGSIVESFANLATDALNSLDQLVSGIKSGNIVDILSGVLGIVQSVAGIIGGAGGGGIPGFANGTNYAPGGLAWVGERGRELVNLPRGSQVIPNHKLGDMAAASPPPIVINNSAFADVFVNGKIAQAAPAIAAAGSAGAQQAVARRQTRRVA